MTSIETLTTPVFRAAGDTNNHYGRPRSIDDIPEIVTTAETQARDRAALAGDEKEILRRKYLLFRFWRTAAGFWSRSRGDRLAWVLLAALFVLIFANLAAQFGINLWNRKIFDALEQRDSADRAVPVRRVLSAGGRQRRVRRDQCLGAHDDATALARLGIGFRHQPLAEKRTLLPAQPGQRRSSESGRPADRRSCASPPTRRSISPSAWCRRRCRR